MASTQAAHKYAVVLVPGSFSTPALYEDNLTTVLRKKGCDVRPTELLSSNDGTRMPPATMEEDAAHIRAAVISVLDDATSPKNVVISLHSYSGVPGSSALKGLSKADRTAQGKNTAVIGIVYIGSFVPALGQSVRDLNPEAPEPYLSGIPGEYLPPVPEEFAPLIFNDLSPEDGLNYVKGFVRHSSDSYSGKTSYEAWKDISSVYIIPEKDMIIPTPLQEDMYQKAVAAGGKIKRVFVEGAGHAVNVSQTELVVGEMIKLGESEL